MTQAKSWIGEKQKKLEVEMNKGEVSSLEDKIKKLQKHQAFQAELSANQPRITIIKENGNYEKVFNFVISTKLQFRIIVLLSILNNRNLERYFSSN